MNQTQLRPLLLAMLLVAEACHSTPVIGPNASTADAAAGPNVDAALATADTSDAASVPGDVCPITAPDVVWQPDAGLPYQFPPTCKDVRKVGDERILNDNCWAPPYHYCSGMLGNALADLMCKPPDFSLCCFVPNTDCVPCGWTRCLDLPQGCVQPSKIAKANIAECSLYRPNFGDTVCWDGVDPGWVDQCVHEGDSPASH